MDLVKALVAKLWQSRVARGERMGGGLFDDLIPLCFVPESGAAGWGDADFSADLLLPAEAAAH